MSKSKVQHLNSTVTLIAAMSENRVIGRGNALPWHLPDDLKRFKALTMGHPVIMGRKTFDSIGKPLPGRRTIVITRNPKFQAPGAAVAASLDRAIELARGADGDDEVFIAGGGEIFAQAMARADRIHLTLVHASIDGDAFFPEINAQRWKLVEDQRREADDRHAHSFSFRMYERAARRDD